MSGDRDREFRRFVVAARPALVRSALLLTGDAGAAEDLVRAALLRGYRRWNRLAGEDALASVRGMLVSASLARWRRPSRAGQVLTEGADDEVLVALRRLPPRMRAVVVLRFHDDLSAAETARLLGCSVAAVEAEATAALTLLEATPADREVEPR